MDIIKHTRIVVLCVIIIAVAIYFPARHARHYDYIEDSKVLDELVVSSTRHNESNLRFCTYEDIIANNRENEYSEIYEVQKFEGNIKGIMLFIGFYHYCKEFN